MHSRRIYKDGALVQILIDGVPQPIDQPVKLKPWTPPSKHAYIVTGPGTELKKLIARFGLRPSKMCKCNQRILEMNQKGADWCTENIETIVGWLREEAGKARIPFVAAVAKVMIRKAIRNSRKLTE